MIDTVDAGQKTFDTARRENTKFDSESFDLFCINKIYSGDPSMKFSH